MSDRLDTISHFRAIFQEATCTAFDSMKRGRVTKYQVADTRRTLKAAWRALTDGERPLSLEEIDYITREDT